MLVDEIKRDTAGTDKMTNLGVEFKPDLEISTTRSSQHPYNKPIPAGLNFDSAKPYEKGTNSHNDFLLNGSINGRLRYVGSQVVLMINLALSTNNPLLEMAIKAAFSRSILTGTWTNLTGRDWHKQAYRLQSHQHKRRQDTQ